MYPSDHLVENIPHGSLLRQPSRIRGMVLRRKARSTRLEQWLLAAAVVVIPLENRIPNIAGFGVTFIVFGVLAWHVVLNRSQSLARVWLHPVFITAYALLFVALFIESAQPESSYREIVRVALMIIGAVLIATICVDRRALLASIVGYLIVGVTFSFLLFLTSYGALSESSATDFANATNVREEVFLDNPLQVNLNDMAFVAAKGAVTALALMLCVASSRQRLLFVCIALLCTVAAFLPMSRGGIGAVVIAAASVLFTYGVGRAKTMLIGGLLAAGVAMWVPSAVWSRVMFSTESNEDGKLEGRARVYTAATEHFPDYALSGVGAGNFWGSWGMQSQFKHNAGVAGSHNVFFQVTIYWGLTALGILIALIWQLYRYFPKRCANDALALCLVGISVSSLILTLVIHNLYSKEFSLALGLIVGACTWIWPGGIVPSASRRRRHVLSVRRPATHVTPSTVKLSSRRG
jgi:hypothetical protein